MISLQNKTFKKIVDKNGPREFTIDNNSIYEVRIITANAGVNPGINEGCVIKPKQLNYSKILDKDLELYAYVDFDILYSAHNANVCEIEYLPIATNAYQQSPVPVPPNIDTSQFVSKDDLKQMVFRMNLNEAMLASNYVALEAITPQPPKITFRTHLKQHLKEFYVLSENRAIVLDEDLEFFQSKVDNSKFVYNTVTNVFLIKPANQKINVSHFMTIENTAEETVGLTIEVLDKNGIVMAQNMIAINKAANGNPYITDFKNNFEFTTTEENMDYKIVTRADDFNVLKIKNYEAFLEG